MPLQVEKDMNKLFMALILLLTGCVGIPENVKPVENFKLENYLGSGMKLRGWIIHLNGVYLE